MDRFILRIKPVSTWIIRLRFLPSWFFLGSKRGAFRSFSKGPEELDYSRISRLPIMGMAFKFQSLMIFNPPSHSPVPYIFNTSNGPFQYRERLARQKCDAFQLQIQEIVTGAAGEYVDFSDLSLEIAVKTGINKLPGWQTVR